MLVNFKSLCPCLCLFYSHLFFKHCISWPTPRTLCLLSQFNFWIFLFSDNKAFMSNHREVFNPCWGVFLTIVLRTMKPNPLKQSKRPYKERKSFSIVKYNGNPKFDMVLSFVYWIPKHKRWKWNVSGIVKGTDKR